MYVSSQEPVIQSKKKLYMILNKKLPTYIEKNNRSAMPPTPHPHRRYKNLY